MCKPVEWVLSYQPAGFRVLGSISQSEIQSSCLKLITEYPSVGWWESGITSEFSSLCESCIMYSWGIKVALVKPPLFGKVEYDLLTNKMPLYPAAKGGFRLSTHSFAVKLTISCGETVAANWISCRASAVRAASEVYGFVVLLGPSVTGGPSRH